MPAGIARYKGLVAAVNSRDYDFVNRETGERVQGVAHRMFLVTDDESEPMMELRVNDDLAVKARQLQGKPVEVGAEPRARNDRVVWHATYING